MKPAPALVAFVATALASPLNVNTASLNNTGLDPREPVWRHYCPSEIGYDKMTCCNHNFGHHHKDCINADSPFSDTMVTYFEDANSVCLSRKYNHALCCKTQKVMKLGHVTNECVMPCTVNIRTGERPADDQCGA